MARRPDKKELREPIAASYDPATVETYWSRWWDDNKFFTPNTSCPKKNNNFVIVLPPPNVTGSLHLGHTLTVAIEDALTRWHRMNGRQTLWIPGVDHAGIATQSIVERTLLREENVTRHDIGREKFLEKAWAWKRQYGDRIYEQLRLVGASVDWTRAAFTMDPKLSEAVVESFVRMYDEGLIYRKTRLVSWSSYLRTALSEIEVDYEEIDKPTKIRVPGFDYPVEVGYLWHFFYVLKDDSTMRLEVATTRIETMLGDVAVAVHPDDARFKGFVGKLLTHPFFPERQVKVVADTHVDPEFGTGAVKITPAHDRNDYEIGVNHDLEAISVFDTNGRINENGGPFAGQHRFECRHNIQKALSDMNLLGEKKANPRKMQIPLCSRSHDIIEFLLLPQWWVDCTEMADRAVAAVRDKSLKILPSFHEQTWNHWLENIKPWCISRQLWWGHRVPAYRVKNLGDEVWVVGRNEDEARDRAWKLFDKDSKLINNKNDIELSQDDDVLDTWFSSALFPFSTLGWPEKTDDMNQFFPNTLLETGHDILFFWVARMVMVSLQLLNKLPFNTVYLHAMVRDSHGQKMSKSKGNVLDPIEVIDGITAEQLAEKITNSRTLPQSEVKRALAAQKKDFPNGIPKCGADALRLGLLAYTKQGRSVNLDINRVVGYRHFCNKLWNAVKFALMNFPADFRAEGVMPNQTKLDFSDQWILHRLATAAGAANKSFAAYQLTDVVSALYDFWLYEFCDVYLELLKPRLQDDRPSESKTAALETLCSCLDYGLRLLHPLIPFVTEELYQRLPERNYSSVSISVSAYPQQILLWDSPELDETMRVMQLTVKQFRSLLSSLEVPPKERPTAFISCDPSVSDVFTDSRCKQIATLSKLRSVTVVNEKPPNCVHSVASEKVDIYLDPAGVVNLDHVIKRLDKRIIKETHNLETLKAKVSVQGYAENVPAPVQETNRLKLDSLQEELKGLMLAKTNVTSLLGN